MIKHGDTGLGYDIVKAVINGDIIEPITYNKIKKYCVEKRIDANENHMRVLLSNGSENTHSPTYKQYFQKVGRGKYSILPEYRRERQFYWLNVDSAKYEWAFSNSEVGSSQCYSNLNANGNYRKNVESFKNIQIGDLTLVYETGDLKAITTICEVVKKYEENGEIMIEFQKKIDFQKYIHIDALKATTNLLDCPLVYFRRGTLFNLEKGHFKIIEKMLEVLNSKENPQDELDKAVLNSLSGSSKERRMRLSKRVNLIPDTYEVKTKAFKRDPDVIAEVLLRAAGICEKCKKAAPFKRIDGSPYLEVHHIQWLSNGGEDTVANTIAVCPNCHRELHYGDQSTKDI